MPWSWLRERFAARSRQGRRMLRTQGKHWRAWLAGLGGAPASPARTSQVSWYCGTLRGELGSPGSSPFPTSMSMPIL